jgi:hypothetical protein
MMTLGSGLAARQNFCMCTLDAGCRMTLKIDVTHLAITVGALAIGSGHWCIGHWQLGSTLLSCDLVTLEQRAGIRHATRYIVLHHTHQLATSN